METEITDIGKVAITPQKDYQNERTYEWLDVVTYDGAGYMCIAEDGCTGIVPTNTDCWQLLADKGHFTKEDKEEFKKAVVEESKTEINEHTDNKKTELNNYTTELEKSLENELDKYKTEKEAEMDLHKATLETEMANKKDSLIEEIETAQDGFDANVEEKTNTFNSNVETKTTEFNNNSNAKTEEFNNNSTEKINNFNSNAEEKIADYNKHVENLTSRIADLEEENSELAQQMPWNTTEISESIHVEDSAKYSKNKLSIFGNLKQDTRNGNNLFDVRNAISQYKVDNNDWVTVSFDNTNGTNVSYFNVFTGVNNDLKTNTTYYIVVEIKEVKGTGRFHPYSSTDLKTSQIIGSMGRNYSDLKTIEIYKVTTKDDFSNSFTMIRTFCEYNVGQSGSITFRISFIESEPTVQTFNYEKYGIMPSIEFESMPVVTTGLQKITKSKAQLYYPDLKIFPKVDSGVTFSLNDDGSIVLNGTSTSSTNTRIGVLIPSKIQKKINGTTYSMKIVTKGAYDLGNSGSTAPIGNIGLKYSGNSNRFIIENIALGTYSKTQVYTKRESDVSNMYFTVRIANAGITFKNYTIYPMLTKGDTPMDYEPCTEETFNLDLGDTELCKITDSDGNVVAQDKAVYRLQEDGTYKWQWEKNIPKIVIDGTTINQKVNLRQEKEKYDIYSIYLKQSILKQPEYYGLQAIVSNMFKTAKNYGTLAAGTNENYKNLIAHWIYDGTSIVFSTELGKFANIEEANAYLAENNLIVYGKGANAQYIDCTTDQIEVLEKLYKLQLEKGVNNIFVESENGVTTELQLEYMQDNNLIQKEEHKALEDRITAIEALLSTTQTSALLLDNMQEDLESEVK